MLVKHNPVKLWIWVLGFALIIAAVFYVSLDLVYANRVLPGVWLGEVNLSGESLNDLPVVIDAIVKEATQKQLAFKSGDWEKIYSLKTLGINFIPSETSTAIAKFGRGNNAFVNFWQRSHAVITGVHVATVYQDQLDKLNQNIIAIGQAINQAGVDGEVLIVGREAIIKPAVTGVAVDEHRLEQITREQLSQLNFTVIDLPVQTTLPKFTSEIAQATADRINQNLAQPYTLKTRIQEIELTANQLWDWAEVIKQPESFLVRLRSKEVNKYVQTLKNTTDQPAINAVFVMKNDRVIEFVPDQLGITLDTDKIVELIQQTLLTDQRQIDLPAHYTEPKITLGESNKLGIKELVAQGESNFAGSPKNRRHNIKVGASKFNNVIIKPDEKFSFNKILGEVDASTGYLPELVIKGDETTPEFGGGLCQVSTTTFRAALAGGYPIVARQNHRYRVSYYEPAGTDATVYQPYPDLQFLNDTPYHILIHTYIEGDSLYFDFYSTSSGYRVELEGPRIYDITEPPPPIYIETSTLPEGEQKKIDTAHKGADTILYRHIFNEKGREIRKDTFKSHYVPWPEKYLVGVSEAPKVETNLGNVPPEATSQETASPPPNNPTI
ncbi:VanW family protein [Patescibacteria group bacterium]|nr:VanW family protein [Patescibacteria group bacterium]